MLTLLTLPGSGTGFSLSPFCNKAAMLLAYSGVDWQREDLTDPRAMPLGKLPVLRTPDRLVPDSGGIRDWLEERGTDFDPGLGAVEKSHGQALIRMAEEYLYFHVVQDRWNNDAVWPTIRELYFGAVPRLIRRPVTARLRRAVQQSLHRQGLARFSPAARMSRLDKDLGALETLLWNSPFLQGDRMSSADFSVAPMLAAMRDTPVETELTRRISGDAVLCAYLDRVAAAVPLP